MDESSGYDKNGIGRGWGFMKKSWVKFRVGVDDGTDLLRLW